MFNAKCKYVWIGESKFVLNECIHTLNILYMLWYKLELYMRKYEVLTCVESRRNGAKHENKVQEVLICKNGSMC